MGNREMESSVNIKREIRIAVSKQADADSASLPQPHTVRRPSKTEMERLYVPYGYHSLVCLHDKLYFEACPACRRTTTEGKVNFAKYLESKLARTLRVT